MAFWVTNPMSELKLHQNRQREPVLILPQVRIPAWYQLAELAVITPHWREAARAGEIGHVSPPVIAFRSERDELRGHVIERDRRIPSLVLIARVFREIGRSGLRRGAIDRRQQHQIPSNVLIPFDSRN